MGKISEDCRCPRMFEELNKQGMTRIEFAERIGASTGNVSDWAAGKSSPSRRRWQKISEVLGKPIEELRGLKDDTPPDVVSKSNFNYEWADVEKAYREASPDIREAAKAAALAVLNSKKE